MLYYLAIKAVSKDEITVSQIFSRFAKVRKIAIQRIALSGFRTTAVPESYLFFDQCWVNIHLKLWMPPSSSWSTSCVVEIKSNAATKSPVDNNS